MSKTKIFFTKMFLRIDLAIFSLLYIPITIVGIMMQILYYLFKIISNPIVIVILFYVFFAFSMYPEEPITIKNVIPLIVRFTLEIKNSGKLFPILGVIAIGSIAIVVIPKLILAIAGVSSITDTFAKLDRRLDVKSRIQNDLERIKELDQKD